MTALFDCGNSRLHFGWWDGVAVRDSAHVSYPSTPDELIGLLRGLMGGSAPECIAGCSVSTKYGVTVFSALASLAPGKLRIAGSAPDIGLQVRYDHPESYGIDRALAARAAHGIFRDSCVVIDAGTAITIDAVAADGSVGGGYIFPGEEAMAYALAARAGLPDVTVGESSPAPGNSTETCISRAIALGSVGAVRLLAERAADLVDGGGRMVITGGGGEKLYRSLGISALHRPDLVLEGLGLVSEQLPEYRG